MSYKNDVVLVLTKDGSERFKFEMSCISNSETKKEVSKLIYSPSQYIINGICECYIWNAVNWNIEKDSISWIMDIIQVINPNDILFIRTGEEWFDFEIIGEYYNNPFNIHLDRNIITN